MISADGLRKAWQERGRFAVIEPVMTITEAGLVLGAGTILAKFGADDGGSPLLDLAGKEQRVLALLTVAYGRTVNASVIDHIHRAAAAYARGETSLALIHLAYTGLSTPDDEKNASYRLFLADELLERGVATARSSIGLWSRSNSARPAQDRVQPGRAARPRRQSGRRTVD